MRIARDLYPDRGLTTLSASISYDSHQRFPLCFICDFDLVSSLLSFFYIFLNRKGIRPGYHSDDKVSIIILLTLYITQR